MSYVGYWYPGRAPTAAELGRIRWCADHGHQWKPLRDCKPGDEHWCGYCETRRIIGANGVPEYQRPWE